MTSSLLYANLWHMKYGNNYIVKTINILFVIVSIVFLLVTIWFEGYEIYLIGKKLEIIADG